jgi:hypothetical protein
VERCASSLSMTTSFSGVVQQVLGDGCGMMISHMTVVLSSIMVTSMAGQAR